MAALWEKLLFWKKQTKPKYKFVNYQENATCLEITAGKYAGVIYSYGTVKFSQEFGLPKLSFGFDILYSGEYDLITLQNDQDFVTIMGDILTEIIIENEPIRTNNSEESDLQ